MARRTTRSHTLRLEKAPVYTFPVNANRKSATPKQSGQPLTPITNQPSQHQSASNGQSAESKKAKDIQVTPSFISPTATTATKRKSTPNGKRNSSAITNRDKEKIVEPTPVFESITRNTARRITRSQSVLLKAAPVNIGKRKSEPAKIRDQHLTNQSNTSLASAKKIVEPTPAFETIVRNKPGRDTRSKSILLTTAAVNIEKRKSEPAKIHEQHLTNQSNTMQGLSTSLTSSKKIAEPATVFETIVRNKPGRLTRSQSVLLMTAPVNILKRNITGVTQEISSTSKKSLAAAKVKTFPENRSVPEASIANVPTEAVEPSRRRHTIGSFQSEAIVTTASNQRQGKAAVSSGNDATKITSNIVPRRSTRSTLGVTLNTKEYVAREADTPALRASQPSKVGKVGRRRHTVNSLQSPADANVAIVQDQGKSTEVLSSNDVTMTDEIGTGAQSSTVKKRAYRSKTSSAKTIGTPTTSTRVQCKDNGIAFIKITDDLRKILIDDSKFVNTSKKLYDIPTDFNVADVIEEYVTIAGNEASDSWNSYPLTNRVLFHGIIQYFDALIGRQLLYEPERAQYELVLNSFPGVPMSQIYPPIYLLRLLVQLNKLLHFKKVADEILKFSVIHLDHFIKYLSDNKSTFFNVSG